MYAWIRSRHDGELRSTGPVHVCPGSLCHWLTPLRFLGQRVFHAFSRYIPPNRWEPCTSICGLWPNLLFLAFVDLVAIPIRPSILNIQYLKPFIPIRFSFFVFLRNMIRLCNGGLKTLVLQFNSFFCRPLFSVSFASGMRRLGGIRGWN